MKKTYSTWVSTADGYIYINQAGYKHEPRQCIQLTSRQAKRVVKEMQSLLCLEEEK